MKIIEQHPDFNSVYEICQKLKDHKFQALLVGGCVRDGLINRLPKDFDIATDAKPEQVQALFAQTIAVGKSFGVIKVVMGPSIIDVATFREDVDYQNGRSPNQVIYTDAATDAKRRDFTINALFYDLQAKEVLDYTQGLEDLRLKSLKAIGVPKERFLEDHLRMLRAVRLAAELDFKIEETTWAAIIESAPLIQKISGERVQEELNKLLKSEHRVRGLKQLVESGLFENIFSIKPDWNEKFNEQTEKIFATGTGKVWSLFFVWLHLMDPAKDLQGLLKTLRFSNEFKTSLPKTLWIFANPKFDLGDWVEKSYDNDYQLGLTLYESLFTFKNKDLRAVREQKMTLGDVKPLPLLSAKDIDMKGPQLGAALKKLYHAQLEGKFTTKRAALNFANQLKNGK